MNHMISTVARKPYYSALLATARRKMNVKVIKFAMVGSRRSGSRHARHIIAAVPKPANAAQKENLGCLIICL